MDQPAGLQVDYVFRGVEHAVRVVVSGQVLELEVEDRMTADQWRGEFDASFIEDLTHKTGNFKQFNIFCNMLESALTQSSESVTLDLLTYTDLESLRNRKMGGRPGAQASRSAQLNSKRYLILIYSVEFDRKKSVPRRLPTDVLQYLPRNAHMSFPTIFGQKWSHAR
uniref:Coiled-coil domain containing 61 n=1 Tax=Equus caballus TaxID=9796 RepID=A0A9L0RXG8_HORSE